MKSITTHFLNCICILRNIFPFWCAPEWEVLTSYRVGSVYICMLNGKYNRGLWYHVTTHPVLPRYVWNDCNYYNEGNISQCSLILLEKGLILYTFGQFDDDILCMCVLTGYPANLKYYFKLQLRIIQIFNSKHLVECYKTIYIQRTILLK